MLGRYFLINVERQSTHAHIGRRQINEKFRSDVKLQHAVYVVTREFFSLLHFFDFLL